MKSISVFVVVIVLVSLGAVLSDAQSNACTERCCCKVCSTSNNEAFPYGYTTEPIATNPVNPQVVGATCKVPVWKDMKYNLSDGTPADPPATIFWKDHAMFGDDASHVAPSSCICCQLSVHTSCSEERPRATRPRTIIIDTGIAIAKKKSTFSLTGGFELSNTDIVQLRNNTHCGYNESTVELTNFDITDDTRTARIQLTYPDAGCYVVCYYHSGLTTPTWYNIGYLTVNPEQQDTINWQLKTEDVPLGGNIVRFSFTGSTANTKLLDVFDDAAEIRKSGNCGADSPEPAARTGVNDVDTLQVPDGYVWCSPPVVPRITTNRPLRYIDIKYKDCKPDNRVYQPLLYWTVALPLDRTTTSYYICYRTKGVWVRAKPDTLQVIGRSTQAQALKALYTSTGGASWSRNRNWDVATDPQPCTMFGILCNDKQEVTTLVLSRNNLKGPLPPAFFHSDLAGSLVHLNLDMNQITGTVIPAIGALKKLTYLDLGFNNLTGDLPDETLGLESIDAVYLGDNEFTGEVPRNLDRLSLQWYLHTRMKKYKAPVIKPACPVDEMMCSNKGSTDAGVYDCGYDGITEAECLVRNCCFNAQTPLVFGGSTCFTRRSVTYFTYPQCTKPRCEKQADFEY